MKKCSALDITMGGVIAALYVIMTFISQVFGLSTGPVQLRLSEALCILPAFIPVAVPGLFIGCLLANILSGCILYDVIFGSLATLIGACGTFWLRKRKYAAFIPPILANTVVVPVILVFFYNVTQAYLIVLLSILISETISVFLLGLPVYMVMKRVRIDKNS